MTDFRFKCAKRTAAAFFLAAVAFAASYPAAFLLIGSFMGQDELVENLQACFLGSGVGYARWSLLPRYPTLRSYAELLLDSPEFFTMFWNSIKVEAGVLAGQLLIGLPAAWGFAKYRFPFRKLLFTMYIILMMLPFQIIMLPQYLVLDQFHLMDTLWAVILPGIFSTFPVFLLYNSFQSIPGSLMEAARLEGASELQIFFYIGIPAARPGIVSVMILQFLEYWYLIEQPVTFLKDKTLWPLSLYLPQISPENAGASLAAAAAAMIPSVLVFFAGQKSLEQGISAAAVKE